MQEGISNSSTEINGTASGGGHKEHRFKPKGHNAATVIKSKANGFTLKLSHLRSSPERTLPGQHHFAERQDTALNEK